MKWYKDIRVWIIVFFIIRLIGITNPPLEIGHSWRQVTGLMVARNFFEDSANPLYPKADELNSGSGLLSMEFPLMNYIHFIIAKLFGFNDWYGRLINLVVSSFGLWYFFKIIKRFFNEKHAFVATILLCVSIWFSFSRKNMPDTFSISFILISVYFGLKFLYSGHDKASYKYLMLFSIFGLLGILSKIPAVIYWSVFILPLLDKSIEWKRKLKFLLSTVVPLTVGYWWYFIWNPYLSSLSGNWYNFGKPITEGAIEIVKNSSAVFRNFYFNAFMGFGGFVLFLVGLIMAFLKHQKMLVQVFTVLFITFILYIFKAGFLFYHHNYYIIPFVPVMALMAAYPLTQLRRKGVLIFLLAGVSVEGIANQQHDFFIKRSEEYKLELESIADKYTSKNDMIAINGNSNPQMLFLAHRKGWNCNNEDLKNPDYIEKLKKGGCKILIVNRHLIFEPFHLPLLYEDDHFRVYSLNSLKVAS